jgi:hypothetical protein
VAFRHHENPFIDFTKVAFLDFQEVDICSQCSYTSSIIASSNSPKSHFTHPESRLWFLRVILLLETSVPRLRPSRFFFLDQKEENEFDIFKLASLTSTKSHFKTSRRQIMSSQVHLPTSNITFATSSKSHF